MPRRLPIDRLRMGALALSEAAAHHARVLRLEAGEAVELFDAAGQTGSATLTRVTPNEVIVEVTAIREAGATLQLTIASAVPKGPRADWMIEKLAEIGVDRVIPLMTQRSVVHPEGAGKLQRWNRLATEAARQSRRAGMMRIDALMPLQKAVEQVAPPGTGYFAATETAGESLATVVARAGGPVTVFIGPEGGWSDEEVALFGRFGLKAVTLGGSILRTETAALVAAGIVAALGDRSK